LPSTISPNDEHNAAYANAIPKNLKPGLQAAPSIDGQIQNQKANQHDGLVNVFINKNRGSNERVLRCLSSKCISITNQFVQVIYERVLRC